MSGLSRSRFLGLGVALGAAIPLAACGSSGGGSEEMAPMQTTAAPGTEAAEDNPGVDSGQPNTDTTMGSGESGSADSIVSTSEVPVGESYNFDNDGEPAILVHESQDRFVAYSAICTHQGCEVAYRNTEFVCPCHGSVFSVSDGAPTTGPAQSPLPSVPVEVQGGNVVRA